jgi:hypothetical protein
VHRSALQAFALIVPLAAVLAGCTSAPDGKGASTSASGQAPPAMAAPTIPLNSTALPPSMLHEVAVNVAFTSAGSGTNVTPGCPAQPAGVTASAPIELAAPTPFDGTFVDIGCFAVYPDIHYLKGVWVFTGSIEGCTGSGTATFPYVAWTDDQEPASADGVHGHDWMSAPTSVTGSLRITDADLDADYYLTPGTFTSDRAILTGTVTCE